MNPILLKPVTNIGSQVVVNGEPIGNMSAAEYFETKRLLLKGVVRAYNSLADEYDVVVLEGAGSPAEINLKKDDIVNMGMAKLAKAPVALVGDIDRGGVFAHIYGTVALLDEDERNMIKATIINKFRGDPNLLYPGIEALEKLTGKPTAGVIPYLSVDIDDEDSLSERLTRKSSAAVLDIAIIRLPRISNFTDFTALEASPGARVRYASDASELGLPDMLILPGTKNTISDLKWLRESGLEASIKNLASRGTVIFGICGGYQALGRRVTDAENAEGGGDIEGIGLLPVHTDFAAEKHLARVAAKVLQTEGPLAGLSGVEVEGYEIHMGKTTLEKGANPFLALENATEDGCSLGNAYGTYLHGFFDAAACREALFSSLCKNKGVSPIAEAFDLKAYKERQYNLLADELRKSLDMKLIYRILEEGV
jgi:adenosylcobyric acid synthase